MNGVISRIRPDDATRSRTVGAATAGDVVSLLPIGADLLPPRSGTGRGGHRRRLVALGIVLAAVVVVAGSLLLSVHARSTADARLTAAQDQQRSLQVQSRSYASLVGTQQQATALRDSVATLMATDAPWSTLLGELGGVRGGVAFTAVQAGVDDPSAPTQVDTGPAVTGRIGTLSISGTAADKPTIATFVDALSGLGGLTDPFLSNVTAVTDGGGYSFTVSVTLTDALRSAAKNRWSTTTGGGK